MNTVALEVDYASDIALCASCRLARAAERLRAVQGKSGHGGGYARQGGVSEDQRRGSL